jgi:peptide-methionine (S)-S-oxide reductase
LEIYLPNIDPLDGDGQFCDQGDSYRPAIFYGEQAQRAAAETSKRIVSEAYDLDDIAVSIEELTSFYPAEYYHQNYYQMNPIRYTYYRWGCGRDARLNELWDGAERVDIFD